MMKELQMYVLYSEDIVVRGSIRLPMQKIQNGKWTDVNSMHQEYPEAIKEHSIWLGRILDDNYKKADLEQKVNKLIPITKFQRVVLLSYIK